MNAIILPMIVMVLFCALYSGAFLWMRRESFGEGRQKRRVSHHKHR